MKLQELTSRYDHQTRRCPQQTQDDETKRGVPRMRFHRKNAQSSGSTATHRNTPHRNTGDTSPPPLRILLLSGACPGIRVCRTSLPEKVREESGSTRQNPPGSPSISLSGMRSRIQASAAVTAHNPHRFSIHTKSFDVRTAGPVPAKSDSAATAAVISAGQHINMPACITSWESSGKAGMPAPSAGQRRWQASDRPWRTEQWSRPA